jgi:hypothetical protein
MYRKLIVLICALCTLTITAGAAEIPIIGTVSSKCVITTDTTGIYGNPTIDKLSTAATDGGVMPIVRYDVFSANAYKAVISTPTTFSTSPTLNDVVSWTGETSVSRVSVAGMSAYDTNKRVYNNTTEFDLTLAGSTWFKSSSTATYGTGKAFPGGTYRAVIVAECIAL